MSLHPHGVFYRKNSEGAGYNDGTSGRAKADDAIAPGGTHRYVWQIPPRSGPGPNDPSSVLWMYHSHVDESGDTNAGLVGPIIVTAKGKARRRGRGRLPRGGLARRTGLPQPEWTGDVAGFAAAFQHPWRGRWARSSPC